MDKNNYLIKLLLDNKTKPNLLKYTLEELVNMYLEFIETCSDNNIYKILLEKEYTQKTIDILNSIFYNKLFVNNKNMILGVLISNQLDDDNEKKKILIIYMNYGKKYQLLMDMEK